MNPEPVYIESPCVRRCCLDTDDICLGCFRSLDEIRHWADAGRNGRLRILEKADQRKQTRSKN